MNDTSKKSEPTLLQDIESVINKHSREARSGTPDFILAEYLTDCLSAYEKATNQKDIWHESKEEEE